MHGLSKLGLFAMVVCTMPPSLLRASEPERSDVTTSEVSSEEINFHADYVGAMNIAKEQGKMMFIFFYRPGENGLREEFESTSLTEPGVRERLQDHVYAKLPLDAKIPSEDGELSLLEHSSFKELQGKQGIVILDFAHKNAEYFGWVVSVFPFTEDRCYSARQMRLILDLPGGTPDQRKRAYAARTVPSNAVAEEEPGPDDVESLPEPPRELFYHTDFAQACEEARRDHKMLALRLYRRRILGIDRRFNRETMADATVCEKLHDYVYARLPLGASITFEGKTLPIIDHPAFEEMLGQPGLAILDFVDEEAEYYGRVVSTFPLTEKLWYTPEQMRVILDLPPGTLTQRTLIYAVRIHRDKPASTRGQIHPTLLKEAESHSAYQARIKLQGHHRWETRFHQINAKMPMGLSACEVCAESWPGEHLLEAAIECVRCWRFSAGHWSAVRKRHEYYGYDMKRGPNQIWYATGIFSGN